MKYFHHAIKGPCRQACNFQKPFRHMVMGENIMDELATLIRTEIPDGRQSLRDSYTNLERVADYCEDTYYRTDKEKKKAALEATKNYTTQSLASVAYQINTLAYSYMQLLELQAQQLMAPINPEKPIKYVRKPIDYSILDDIGHGVNSTVQSGRQKHRGSSHGSVQSLAQSSVVGPPPTTKPPTPPQMSRGNTGTLGKSVSNTGTLGKSSREYRTPPVVNPPQVPSHYAPNYPIGHPKRISSASSSTTATGVSSTGIMSAATSSLNNNNERAAGYSALPMPPSQQIATHVNLPSAGMMQSLPPPPPTTYDDRNSMPPPPSPLTVSQHELTEQSHIGMHTLGLVAIYDYYADKDDELSFQESSVLYVLKKNDDGWWEGVMDGVTGLFPGNYVEPYF
uniref:SH3 domain-containing protein n=1 Tax=Glossina brevipalpis TaxID=37001 RepID=A0A1A9WS30_9MUSC